MKMEISSHSSKERDTQTLIRGLRNAPFYLSMVLLHTGSFNSFYLLIFRVYYPLWGVGDLYFYFLF
jgi:hypothetical protein